MSAPLVSAVIATWNTGAFLPAAVASALAQTWPHLEVIVVDDGSTDGTPEAIAPFLPRVRFERRNHQGLAAARNEGIRLARGDYVALLDADDLWRPEKIATQVEIAGRHPETGLVVGNGVEFEDDRVLHDTLLAEAFLRALAASPSGEVTGDFQRDLIERCGINTPSQVLIPRRILQELGPFTDSGAQDYDYYLRISRRHPITVHHHRHTLWRYRPDSMSGPRAERPIRVATFALSVLLAHRDRCLAGCRPLLDARIRELITSLGYEWMKRGREGDRRAASAGLLGLLRARPWPPIPLAYLAALWTPESAYRIGVRVTRPWRATK